MRQNAFILHLCIFTMLLCCPSPLKADKMLIPMDFSQTDHLKAYGVAYHALEMNSTVEWLLNYRGGSFLLAEYILWIYGYGAVFLIFQKKQPPFFAWQEQLRSFHQEWLCKADWCWSLYCKISVFYALLWLFQVSYCIACIWLRNILVTVCLVKE